MSANIDLNNGHTEDRQDEQYPDVHRASSLSEIEATISILHTREATVTARLDSLLSSQKDFQRELGRLDILRAHLSSQTNTTRFISNGMLSDTSATASRISCAVKRLDLEQSRVKATLDVVEQVAELKACVLGVTGSMGAPQDWETAASYLNRASKIPKEIVEGTFAATIVPTAEVPDAPSVTLENAAASLCGLFLREFDKAVKEGDGAKITRFFKLFPLIGRADVGLDVYGRYVCQGVAARARDSLKSLGKKDAYFYSDAFTKLFEHIAQIIENHGGLVERHYGAGSMVKVIERLQIEADMQGGIILDTWGDDRSIDRKLTDIRSYAFTFLVQSFLPAQKVAGGTPRTNSPAIGRPGTPAGRQSEDEGVDMKEIDGLLNEMGIMLGKWSLYTRFLAEKCKDTNAISLNDKPTPLSPPSFLTASPLWKKIATKLLSPYNTMTTFFLRRSVEKAFQLDEPPPDLTLNPHKSLPSNPPHITSAVDDIMYIVNKTLNQALQTSQIEIVTSVVPTLARVLGSDFIGMIQRKMRDESYPKAAIQGALPPETTIIQFLVLVNNLDVASDYITRIVSPLVNSTDTPSSLSARQTNVLNDLFPLATNSATAHNNLQSLSSQFTTKTADLLTDAISVIFNNIMKPRLRPILQDSFRDIDYLATPSSPGTDPTFASTDDDPADENSTGDADLVRRRFQHGWDALTKPIARVMTDRTFDKLLTVVVSYLAEVLEKRIWGYYGRINPFGATRLERDVSSIVTVVVQGRRYGLRQSFERCNGILVVMNMEAEEWDELVEGGQGQAEGVLGDLSLEDGRRARGMIVLDAHPLSPPAPPELDIQIVRQRTNLASRNRITKAPTGISEVDTTIPARDGYQIPARIHKPTTVPSDGGPLIVMYHGGGYCLGSIEGEAVNCRNFVKYFNAVCLNVDYRLAPEHKFPTGPNDAWDALQWAAANAATSPYLKGAAPREKGFLVGGTSAGGNFSAVVAHLAKDAKLDPPLTGQYLSIPSVLPPEVVPERYKSKYLSAEQNKSAPVLGKEVRKMFMSAYEPDRESELFAPFNHPTGHDGLPPAYFQVCGLDPLRDEALIYEEVLREECGIRTRIDVYPGLPHGFWAMFPELKASRKKMKDTVKGVSWLLGTEMDVEDVDEPVQRQV